MHKQRIIDLGTREQQDDELPVEITVSVSRVYDNARRCDCVRLELEDGGTTLGIDLDRLETRKVCEMLEKYWRVI